MTDTAHEVEVELKYRVSDIAAAERYLAATSIGPFIGASQARATQLEDRYVDTADSALERAGYAVRIRASGAGTIVSIKSRSFHDGPGGSLERMEVEGPADRTAPPFDWPASDARSLVLEHVGDAPLIEMVTVRQLRRKRELRDGSNRVELSLDEVDVVSAKRVIGRFVELEAELIKGDPRRLAGLAVALGASPALRPAGGSKLETALAIMRGETDPEDVVDLAGSEEAAPVDGPGPILVADVVEVDRLGDLDEAAGVDDGDRTDASDDRSAFAGAGADDLGADAVGANDLGADDLGPDGAGPDGAGLEGAESPEAGPDEFAPDEAGSPLVEAEAPRLPVSKTAGVLAEDHVAEAGRKVLRFHLARMLAREAGTRSGADIEDLHGMRVATRRQRAAWRVFGDSFRRSRTKRFRTGLRDVAQRLGAVRDLDVLLEAADRYRSDLPIIEQRALEPLLADWRGHREDARVLLMRELDSDGYARWVDDYREFVRTEGAAALPVGPVDPHRVRDTAPSRIWAAYEHVRGYEPVLRWADVETLHDLRIAAKWLRYTLEFVREALGPESAPLIARVTALQDHLGEMHDADVAASMARAFLVEHAGALSTVEGSAIGRYLVSREREVARLRRTLAVPWRGVAGLSFRRVLGRVVAGL